MRFKSMVFSLLVLSALGLVQSVRAEVLLPVNVDGKYGYINTDARMIIEPQFDIAAEFAEGLAMVGKKSGADYRYGYIDEKGVVTIPIKFQDALPFSEGRAAVRFRDYYGFIDTSGNFIAEPEFDRAFSFSEGVARVSKRVAGTFDTLYGFVDKRGKVIIKPQYVYALDFSEGLAGFAVAGKETLKMGFIDKRNRVVIKTKFNIVGPFSEGLAVVAQNGTSYLYKGAVMIAEESKAGMKVMYVNKRGSVVIRGNFETAESFSEGFARVEIDGRCSYIDRAGKVMIQTQFPQKAECGNFVEGLAAINHDDDGAKFIDKTGKTVIKIAGVDWANDFRGGAARVSVSRGNGHFTDGYVDRSGRILWKP